VAHSTQKSHTGIIAVLDLLEALPQARVVLQLLFPVWTTDRQSALEALFVVAHATTTSGMAAVEHVVSTPSDATYLYASFHVY